MQQATVAKKPYATVAESSLYGGSTAIRDYTLLDDLLTQETVRNQATGSWTKLDKSVKKQKLMEFASRYVADNTALDATTVEPMLVSFLLQHFNKFQRNKDVDFQKDTMQIRRLPALIYQADPPRFSLSSSSSSSSASSSSSSSASSSAALLHKSSLTPKRF